MAFRHYPEFLSNLEVDKNEIPVDDLREIIRSEYESRTIQKLLKAGFKEAAGRLHRPPGTSLRIFAIGSIGRLDGDAINSDVDPLLIYDGDGNEKDQRAYCRSLIRETIKGNRCLRFPYAKDIIARKFSFAKRLSYPIMSHTELVFGRGERARVRRMQLLFEGRPVHGFRAPTISAVNSVLSRYFGNEPGAFVDRAFKREFDGFYEGFYNKYVLPGADFKPKRRVTQKEALKAGLFREAMIWIGCQSLGIAFLENEPDDAAEVLVRLSDKPFLLRPRTWVDESCALYKAIKKVRAREVIDSWEAALESILDRNYRALCRERLVGYGALAGKLRRKASAEQAMTYYLNFLTFRTLINASECLFALHREDYRAYLSKTSADWTKEIRNPGLKALRKATERLLWLYVASNAFVRSLLKAVSDRGHIASNGAERSIAILKFAEDRSIYRSHLIG